MKKIKLLITLFLTCLVTSLCAFLLTACGDGSSSANKQVPVYQGMTIANSQSKQTARAVSARLVATSTQSNDFFGGGNREEGNHNDLPYYGDYNGHNEDINQDEPYGDNIETIEEEIKDSLNVVGSVEDLYYATANQDIYITIHISNPDSFEIVSFTLNGSKYSSYMFEDGSDMENIVLKKNVGDAVGYVEYTIDSIKYIDGTAIKDVLIDGNQTVIAGVYTSNQPAAAITNEQISYNSISFNVNISDRYTLIEKSNGSIKAVLYDGEDIISQKDIALGANEVSFDGLETNGLYQYAIVAIYDNLDGKGIATHILSKNAFYTKSVVLFDNISITQTGATFGLIWDDGWDNKTLQNLRLIKGTNNAELDTTATSVSDLLSNTNYILQAIYLNGNKTETIELRFTTLAKATPTIELNEVEKTQTSFTYEIAETDTDNVGAVTKVELIHGDDTTNVEDLTTTTFDNLLSNNTYTVKITYVYNLNDGEGDHTITKTIDIKTETKATPDIVLSKEEVTQTSISYAIAETDTDNVGAVTKVELIHGDDTTNVEDLTTTTFDNLLSNNTYTVKVTYVYNLNDGEGDHTITKTIDIKTETKATPDIVLSKEEATQTSVSYAIVETDTDNVGAVTKVELIHGDDTTNVEDLTTTTFDNLLSNNKYTVKVTYAYDLNDGEGDHTITKTIDITTLIKEKPDLTFENLYLTITSIDISLNIIDTDKTGILSDIQLLNNDVIINKATINEDNAYSFSDLIYGEEYTIKAVYSYDLCDGNGVQELIKELPISLNSKSIHETGSCKLDYSVNDDLTSCTITGIGECKHDDLYIPDNIDGYKVTALASYALKNCIASKITIGNNINSIGDRAFYACKNITEITVPSNINYIGTQIFIGCSSLKTVYWNTDATRDESVLNIASIEKVVFGDNLTYIPNNICYNCTNIKEVILSQNTSSIGNYAFYNCTGLKEIEFPEGLTYTGWYAFYESGLEKIILPSTITSVTNSFRGCHNLTTLVIPVGLTKIDGQAFYVCYNISEIYYIGEEFEWEVVSIDSCNTEVINANVYYYSENQPAGSGSYWHYVEGEAVVW